jgi:hypothetical protein
MDKPKILLQLDTDPHASVFDRVVAIDAGADHVFSYGGVKPEQVAGLVHGLIFTRGPSELAHSAVFIGGSDVAAGEQLLAAARKAMIPKAGLRVSLMLDSNGANTTAAAAVLAASRHMDLSAANGLVLGGTGPVGQRVARLLAKLGAHVRIGSRQLDRAKAVCDAIAKRYPDARLEAVQTATSADGPAALQGRDLVVAAGAAGVILLPEKLRKSCATLRVAIDLNAVPPVGIEGVELGAKAVTHDGVVCYGALGVGGSKMKVHKTVIKRLFAATDAVFDAEEIYDLAASSP